MSGLIATSALWRREHTVALTSHVLHGHIPTPLAAGFSPPPPLLNLKFGALALTAAVARTATLRDDAPIEVLDAVQRSTFPMLETMIAEGPAFSLSEYFSHLADTERTLFAARVGGGVTDLHMNALGYAWRANAICLSSALDPHADFIYHGGNANGHGVVLAEARGSFSDSTTASSIRNASQNKYLRQVKPHLGKPSPYGDVIHGYCVAFGSTLRTPGAFLGVSETKIPRASRPEGNTPPNTIDEEAPGDGVPAPIALAAHRSNFFLMGANRMVPWIDWLRNGESATPPATNPVVFLRLRYAGRNFLVSIPAMWWLDPFSNWRTEFYDNAHQWRHILRSALRPRAARWTNLGCFAMEESAGVAFLKAFTEMLEPKTLSFSPGLQLPEFVPAGFGSIDGDEFEDTPRDDYKYALFRDGLALLGDPQRGRPVGVLEWSPKDGVVRQDWQ
jgi:hypothetical protein